MCIIPSCVRPELSSAMLLFSSSTPPKSGSYTATPFTKYCVDNGLSVGEAIIYPSLSVYHCGTRIIPLCRLSDYIVPNLNRGFILRNRLNNSHRRLPHYVCHSR